MSRARKPRKPTWEEARASEIVGATLGVPVEILDVPPLQNYPDYKVHDGDPPSVLEVTQHVDQDRMELHVAMGRRNYEFPRADLERLWSLQLHPMESENHLKYSQVVSNVDTIAMILGVLEASNQFQFGSALYYERRPNHEADILRRLGIEYGRALSSGVGEPGIHFLPPGDGGATGPLAVVGAALKEARKPDNERKLKRGVGDGEASDRHLFVWISGTKALPYFAMLDHELPATPPALPPWVSQLWIGGRFRTEEVVWRWDGSRWSEVATPTALGPEAGLQA